MYLCTSLNCTSRVFGSKWDHGKNDNKQSTKYNLYTYRKDIRRYTRSTLWWCVQQFLLCNSNCFDRLMKRVLQEHNWTQVLIIYLSIGARRVEVVFFTLIFIFNRTKMCIFCDERKAEWLIWFGDDSNLYDECPSKY